MGGFPGKLNKPALSDPVIVVTWENSMVCAEQVSRVQCGTVVEVNGVLMYCDDKQDVHTLPRVRTRSVCMGQKESSCWIVYSEEDADAMAMWLHKKMTEWTHTEQKVG